jgi:putative ABC transport system permease protein
MLQQLRFYTRHSLNDLRVNRQRTIFALLCIAAGVAAIVSLQTLGVMISDSLTGSLQESNRGDIRIRVDDNSSSTSVQRGEADGVIATGGSLSPNYFTPSGIDTIRAWFEERYPGTVITYRQAYSDTAAAMAASNPRTNIEQMFVTPFIVETKQYPLYGTRRTESGKTLAEVIQAPSDIVISRNLADTLGARVGDTLKLSGANQEFTLRGIVPTSEEGGYENIEGNLLGYYYLDVSALPFFEGALSPGASEIYVRLGDPSKVDSAGTALHVRFPYVNTTTTTDVKKLNTEISDAVNQLVIVMGLVSLLIGGIGIVNTMLVIVSRRTTEIAVLKTIGLEGGQITVLFLVEAVLMGIFGSLVGIVLGWIGAYSIKGVAETFLAQSLAFRITPAPAITGFVVGVIVTTIFGFMPTLAAGQVRPNLVLRPTDTVIPRAGRSRSFAALLFVMLAISLVAQPLIHNLLNDSQIKGIAQGVGGVLGLLMALTMVAGGLLSGWTRHKIGLRILRWVLLLVLLPALGALFGWLVPALLILVGTFVIAGILYVLLWLLIWVVGRFFPSRWLVDLHLALRSMLAAKGRNASTLLALVVGVFTLSLITMLATAISKRFDEVLVNEVGGNVIIFAAGGGNTLDTVQAKLDSLPGVKSYSTMGTYDMTFVSATDVRHNQVLTMSTLQARVRQYNAGRSGSSQADVEMLRYVLGSVDARDVNANLPDVKFYQGRQLDASDAGPWNPASGDYPPIVISADEAIVATGLEVGDLLTFQVKPAVDLLGVSQAQPQVIKFQIVGMVDRRGGSVSVNFGSLSYAPRPAFDALGLKPTSVAAIVDIEESQIPALRQTMNQIPLAFVLETKLLNDLLNRLIDQFTSFPILVAALALVVGGIVIANSVALSTLERRREIAIMKAVGLQRERVLGMLLLEYGLMGLIGGLIGIGLGGIGLLYLLVQAFSGGLGRSIPYVTALELMLLCVGIALAAAVVTAWGASGEKPLNVLRYE